MRIKILFFLIMFTWVFVFVFMGQENKEMVNLLSLQEGTLPVIVPASYGGWPPEALLDESSNSGWACESGQIKNNVFVFEMVSPVVIERFEFDNARSFGRRSWPHTGPGRPASSFRWGRCCVPACSRQCRN